ncbi:hypothetical protein [Alistipes sp.]|uniref:hypothetical protein n=1 Tax=Alistipes sp. TaxID=1872444 RepID=UPI003AF04AE6
MNEFIEIEAHSLCLRAKGVCWRFFYRLRRKAARARALRASRAARRQPQPNELAGPADAAEASRAAHRHQQPNELAGAADAGEASRAAHSHQQPNEPTGPADTKEASRAAHHQQQQNEPAGPADAAEASRAAHRHRQPNEPTGPADTPEASPLPFAPGTIRIGDRLYEETFRRLVEAIGGQNYFSGSVAFAFGRLECRLTASVIVYRQRISCPDGMRVQISDLVPVWWEFHTRKEGRDCPNDFAFPTLKTYL